MLDCAVGKEGAEGLRLSCTSQPLSQLKVTQTPDRTGQEKKVRKRHCLLSRP